MFGGSIQRYFFDCLKTDCNGYFLGAFLQGPQFPIDM